MLCSQMGLFRRIALSSASGRKCPFWEQPRSPFRRCQISAFEAPRSQKHSCFLGNTSLIMNVFVYFLRSWSPSSLLANQRSAHAIKQAITSKSTVTGYCIRKLHQLGSGAALAIFCLSQYQSNINYLQFAPTPKLKVSFQEITAICSFSTENL